MPEFLYHVRHRYDHLTTTRPKVYRYRTTGTTSTTTEPPDWMLSSSSDWYNMDMENMTSREMEEMEWVTTTTHRTTTLSELDK